MENVNFNLDTFMDSQSIINETLSKSNQNIAKAIESFSTSLDEILNNYKKIDNEVKTIKKDNERLGNKIEEAEENYKNLKDATYVLSTDDGKMKELTKLIQRLVYQITGGKNTVKDILFHRCLTNACYKQLYNVFQINTYKRIKIDEFDISLKTIQKWFYNKQNIKKNIQNKLNEYISLQNKNQLSDDKVRLLEDYLEKTEGGLNI